MKRKKAEYTKEEMCKVVYNDIVNHQLKHMPWLARTIVPTTIREIQRELNTLSMYDWL